MKAHDDSAGFVADVDIESEKYRWMGSARIGFYVCLVYLSCFLPLFVVNCLVFTVMH